MNLQCFIVQDPGLIKSMFAWVSALYAKKCLKKTLLSFAAPFSPPYCSWRVFGLMRSLFNIIPPMTGQDSRKRMKCFLRVKFDCATEKLMTPDLSSVPYHINLLKGLLRSIYARKTWSWPRVIRGIAGNIDSLKSFKT